MAHLWLRAEQRPFETRTGLTPAGAADLIAAGLHVTVEASDTRVFPAQAYADAGCVMAPAHSWPDAPRDTIILGLKELPDDGTPLPHRHIMFGHAYKGQSGAAPLLSRFRAGGGALYDLEYLVDDDARRVAAFGYWAGYAGAAVSLRCWLAQQDGGLAGPVGAYSDVDTLRSELSLALGRARPSVLIIGALGRVGTGATDFCASLGLPATLWDQAETADGGPFPAILDHDIFLNCILAQAGVPVFVPRSALTAPRRLSVIGDIACDPTSDFNPVPVYDSVTDWSAPALRVATDPVLDVMAIDNLPSMLPRESSEDFARQLLPHLHRLAALDSGVWGRARAEFDRHIATP